MGIIDKAIGKVLEKVPLTKAIGEIPVLKTIKWTYKAAKTGYQIGTYIDKKTGLSDKAAKGTFNAIGPASKGLIDKVDKISGMVNKGTVMYNDAINKAKSMVGLNQSGVLTQNPSGPKKQAGFIPPSVTKIAAANPITQKIAATKSGLGKPVKSIRSTSSHPAKANKAISPSKTTFNPATSKMFSIKQQAATTKFDPMKSKAFTIKQQTSKTKFNAATSKAFTIKNLATPVKKFTPPKIKTFTPAKSASTLKINLAKSPVKSSFSMKTLTRPIPVRRSMPINRPMMRSVPLKK